MAAGLVTAGVGAIGQHSAAYFQRKHARYEKTQAKRKFRHAIARQDREREQFLEQSEAAKQFSIQSYAARFGSRFGESSITQQGLASKERARIRALDTMQERREIAVGEYRLYKKRLNLNKKLAYVSAITGAGQAAGEVYSTYEQNAQRDAQLAADQRIATASGQ